MRRLIHICEATDTLYFLHLFGGVPCTCKGIITVILHNTLNCLFIVTVSFHRLTESQGLEGT